MITMIRSLTKLSKSRDPKRSTLARISEKVTGWMLEYQTVDNKNHDVDTADNKIDGVDIDADD